MQTGAAVFAVAIDPAAKRVASGGADGSVKLWDAADARLLATFWSGPGSGDQGDWLAFVPEGFYSASQDMFAKAAWKAGGKPPPDAKVLAPLADATKVAKAAQGEKL